MQTAILLGLVYAFAWSMDNIAGSSFMDRPIVCGALTGLVMGNFEQGLVIGGTLELVWMGFISYAGIIFCPWEAKLTSSCPFISKIKSSL